MFLMLEGAEERRDQPFLVRSNFAYVNQRSNIAESLFAALSPLRE
jgi:hypothetical protein